MLTKGTQNIILYQMKRLDWDIEKNQKLIKERGISFEEIVVLIEQGNLLNIVEHPVAKYKHQKIFIVNVRGYVYKVPCIENENHYFLKTIFPSRKATKEYLTEEENYET